MRTDGVREVGKRKGGSGGQLAAQSSSEGSSGSQ
jgi:hypothetical protein